ncbi:hypothetical protein [Colwellia sp. MEBiC06753]
MDYQPAISSPTSCCTPNYFLHQFDAVKNQFCFVHTSQQQLNHCTFLDGRENFSIDDIYYQIDGAEFVEQTTQYANANANANAKPLAMPSFIFHIGFCGSTLLAKLLGNLSTKVVSYKEPQVLIDFAELKAKSHGLYRQPKRWQSYFSATVKQLNKTFTDTQRAVIKPSNWANNLLPELVGLNPQIKAMFITMPLTEFIVAIIRGGKERIGFLYQLKQHLLSAFPELIGISQAIDGSDDEIMLQVTKNAALVYYMQHQLFYQAQSKLDTANWQQLTYKEIANNPLNVLQQSCELFEIKAAPQELESSVAQSIARHAKDSSYPFNEHQHCAISQQIIYSYQQAIILAEHWYQQQFNSEQGCQKIA